jgi:hypothetical protein
MSRQRKNLLRVVKSASIPVNPRLILPKLGYITTVRHLTTEELETALDHLRQAPKDDGVIELIVRRPEVDRREVLDEAVLDLSLGLVGDNWKVRGSKRTRASRRSWPGRENAGRSRAINFTSTWI